MEVRLFATLRPLVGGASVHLETSPGQPVRALLDELVERHPALRPEIYDENGELHHRIHVFINGRDVRYLDGLDMPIPANAAIRIFPPVGGGAR
jgi:molybdopterin synthase sulfur carrier subunit